MKLENQRISNGLTTPVVLIVEFDDFLEYEDSSEVFAAERCSKITLNQG